MTQVARLRVRSVRFKDGGASLTVLRTKLPDMRALLRTTCGEVLEGQSNVVGFTIVAWGADGGSTAATRVSDGSSIPSILVPDFVRNRLLAERIEMWTIDGLKRQ